MESSSDDDFVILTCTNPNPIKAEAESEFKHKKDILISTTDILSWDLHTILCSQTPQIHANRNRLNERSLYSKASSAGALVNHAWIAYQFSGAWKHLWMF